MRLRVCGRQPLAVALHLGVDNAYNCSTSSTSMLTSRKLGTQGLTVSSIGLGLMGMSQSYGSPEERDDRESIATIHRAIELGCTFLDTAEIYGPYTNEELLARALGELGPSARD